MVRRDAIRRETLMASHYSTPHFHNQPGVPTVRIGVKEFMCTGALPPFDHPHTFIDMGDSDDAICPYCSTHYAFTADARSPCRSGGLRIYARHGALRSARPSAPPCPVSPSSAPASAASRPPWRSPARVRRHGFRTEPRRSRLSGPGFSSRPTQPPFWHEFGLLDAVRRRAVAPSEVLIRRGRDGVALAHIPLADGRFARPSWSCCGPTSRMSWPKRSARRTRSRYASASASPTFPTTPMACASSSPGSHQPASASLVWSGPTASGPASGVTWPAERRTMPSRPVVPHGAA